MKFSNFLTLLLLAILALFAAPFIRDASPETLLPCFALGILISPAKLKAFSDGIQIVAANALQGEQANNLAAPLMFETSMTGTNVTLGWLGALPGMRKLEGDIVKKGAQASEITVQNFEFEQTLTVKAIDIHRDKLGVYTPMAAMLGITAAQHPLSLVADLMVAGFTATDYTGSAFFAAGKKAWKGATAFSNKGTKKLSAANFGVAYANLISRQNAYGRPLRLGRNLKLVVHPTDAITARSIVQLQKTDSGADNPYFGLAEVIVLQDLDGAAGTTGYEWFLLETGYPVKPFFRNAEIPLQILSDTNQNTTAFIETHEFNWQAYYSGNVGYALPELAYGSTGADAA